MIVKQHSDNPLKYRIAFTIVMMVLLGIAFFQYSFPGLMMVSSFICFIIFLGACGASIHMYRLKKKAASSGSILQGTVDKTAIVHGFDASFARAGSNSSAFMAQGNGGIWHLFMLLWSEIRLARFEAIIKLSCEDEQTLFPLPFKIGKTELQIGSPIDVKRLENDDRYVYPTQNEIYNKKIRTYLWVAFLALMLSLALCGAIYYYLQSIA